MGNEKKYFLSYHGQHHPLQRTYFQQLYIQVKALKFRNKWTSPFTSLQTYI